MEPDAKHVEGKREGAVKRRTSRTIQFDNVADIDVNSQNARNLFLVKLVHTAIWAFFVTTIGYVTYAGITGDIGLTVWVAIGLVSLEGAVLLLNQGRCPLTNIGARYTDDRSDAFDIFLPNWLAKNNKVIFTSIFLAATALVVYRVIS